MENQESVVNENEETENISDTDDLVSEAQEQLDNENEEEDLLPPEEKNEARQLNIGNIFIFILIIIGVITIFCFLFANNGQKKKNKAEKELNKSGQKVEHDFIKEHRQENVTFDEPKEESDEMTDEEIDDIISSLPLEFQPQPEPGKAPIDHVGAVSSSSGSRSTRPDTKNSKSPRKNIDGLKTSPYSNYTTVSNYPQQQSYGQYGMQQIQPSNPASVSREEYMQNTMNMVGNMMSQNGMTGGQGNQNFQSNRESFFQTGQLQGNASGYWLSENSLWDGTVISAALQTAINTDNPGVVVARVTENVWSSRDANYLLIPEGTLLFATYNYSVSYGQNRVQVAWNLLIRPDGYRVELGNMSGVDAQGASGYKGGVNNHPFQTLKALGLVALYSIIQTEINATIQNQTNDYIKNALTDVYAQGSQIGNRIVNRALDIKPTITIKQGTQIKLITNQPLTLPPVQIDPVTQKYVRYR